MKNKGIIIFLLVLALVIVGVIISDFISKRPDNMDANKFAYSIDKFKNVPDNLILYKETKNFKLGFEKPKGLTVADEKIYLVGDQKLKIIDFSGKVLCEIKFLEEPNTVEVSGDKIYVAFETRIQIINEQGKTQDEWKLSETNSFVTAMAAYKNDVFVANAGIRKIMHFNTSGNLQNAFGGKGSDDAQHGFIVPSPYFDIDINKYGDLWVVNPGLHTLENYAVDGKLREHWKASGAQIENFSGCCNPAHYCFLPDGSFVTSEKGLVRVKVYKPSGEFLGVVAAPSKFEDKLEGVAPDVAADSHGNIYALDIERKILRVFELKIKTPKES